MSRRSITLSVAAALVLIFGIVGARLPVPYVILSPGPTANTLGSLHHKPLIQVAGHKTYPTKGHLNLVTVTYRGGPGSHLDLLSVLRSWADPHDAVVPQEALFPPNKSVNQVNEENTAEMTNSQQSAIAAALHELKIPYRTTVKVAGTEKGKPAAGKLKPGDVITAVGGKKVTGPTSAAHAISARHPGTPVTLSIRRGGKTRDVRLSTVGKGNGEAKDNAMIGVAVAPKYQFPFKINIRVGDIGGPSAGMMFALGVIDKLSPHSLSGGKFVAGTGEIDASGKVGPIGGIQQKLVAARGAGATVFLTPAGNCKDALHARPSGLRLAKVDTLHDALSALRAVRSGSSAGTIESCGR